MWRKLIIPLAFLLGIAMAARADTPPAAKEQLRKLAQLPTVSIQFGFAFDSIYGLGELGTTPDQAGEIASLQKAMQGGPADAERYLRLTVLYGTNDVDKSNEAAKKAVELFRERVRQQPENGRLLADFGRALADVDSDDEAEHVLRKAVNVASNDWHGWVYLGDLLQKRVSAALLKKEADKSLSPDELFKLAATASPAPVQLRMAQNLMNEAMGCYDKAVAVAPREPEVYMKRAVGCSARNTLRGIAQRANGEPADSTQISPGLLSEGIGENMQEVARLDPKNYQAIGLVIFCEITRAASQPGFSGNSAAPSLSSLPDASQKVVRDAMASLQKLEDDPDKRIAAGALETEGTAEFLLMADPVHAETKLRRALALDPARDQAAERLTLIFAMSGNLTNLLSLCESRVKRSPTPRNYLLLAKAYEKLDRAAEAEQQLRTALKTTPDDFACQLGLGLLLMRHPDDASLREAGEHLKLAAGLFAKIPADQQTNEQKTDQLLAAGIYLGLTGQADDARKVFRQMLDNDPDNADAKAGLAALGN